MNKLRHGNSLNVTATIASTRASISIFMRLKKPFHIRQPGGRRGWNNAC